MKISATGAKALGVAVFAMACIATFLFLYQAAGGTLRVSRPYTVNAVLPSAEQLVGNADVRLDGVKIGRIASVDRRGARGLVSLEIDRRYAPLAAGSEVLVRSKTLVGENYLEVIPPRHRTGDLEDGATLPLGQAREAVQIDDILSTLDARTRKAVQRTLDATGRGLSGRGARLNELAGAVRPIGERGAQVARVLALQRRQLSAVVEQSGELLAAVGRRREQVRRLSRQALTTARAVASRDTRLAAAFAALPATLDQARASAGQLEALTAVALPVVEDVDRAAAPLDGALRDLRPAAQETVALVRRLPTLVRRVDPLLDTLAPLSRSVRPALPALEAVLREADPGLAYLSRYSREAGAFFANVGSINDTEDAAGKHGRVHALVGPATFAGYPESVRRAMEALMDAGAVGKILSIRKNPYLPPGKVGDGVPFDGRYPRVAAGG